MWLAFSHDTKQNLKLISDGQESLTATLNVLTKKLQLHVVEIIGEHLFLDYNVEGRGVDVQYRAHCKTKLLYQGGVLTTAALV